MLMRSFARRLARSSASSARIERRETALSMGFSTISVCGACGAKNRVPAAHLADTGRCGVCKAPLEAVHEPLEVDSSSFDEIIAAAKVPVLVDFWASWCGPCRMVAPEVHQLAKEMSGRAVHPQVETEQPPRLAR